MTARPIPEGQRTVTPYLVVDNAADAIAFYGRAFGAVELYRVPAPGGKIGHAELQLGDSRIFLCDEFPGMNAKSARTIGGTPVSIFLWCENVDEAWARATAAGATPVMPLADMFWGDRFGVVTDPFGHQWQMATHKEDLTPEEMERRGREAMANMPK